MKNLKFFLQLFITTLILWYLAYKIPLQQVYQALLKSEFKWFVVALISIFLSLSFMSVRMRLMMQQQNININLWNVLRIRLISFYYKLFIPGGTLANIGVLFYKFSQIKKHQKSGIISAIMFDRVLATIGLSLIGLLCLLISKPNLPSVLIYILALIFISSLTLIIFASNTNISDFFEKDLKKYNNIVSIKLIKFLHAIKEFKKLTKSDLVYLLILTFLPHIFGIFAFTAISYSMDLDLSLLDWGWIRSVVILGTMLPISFAGIGIRDGILIYVLHQYSVSANTAWALSFLLLAATALWPAFLGFILELKPSLK